ncbi:MAG: hemolysin family protein [Anaerolineales bacterium]|jgi:putative hemolysin
MLVGTLVFVALLLSEALIALVRASFVNSHHAKLRALVENGVRRAALAVRVAEEARRLILTFAIALNISRLAVIGVALVVYSLPLHDRGLTPLISIGSILLGVGILMGLLEFLVDNLALRNPERWAVRLSAVAYAVRIIMSPLSWLLSRFAMQINGHAEERSYPLVTEEEIMTLVDAGEEDGVIEEEEKAMIYSIFQLADTLVREVMVPRIDMLAFERETSLVEATESLLRTGFSRAPVFAETIDNIVGLLYAKDILAAWKEGGQHETVRNLCREAYFVPEAKRVDDLLTEMQVKQVHMAIVVDEYGGTAGLVTIEDLVEEIVGEIRDEYDYAEELPFQKLQEGEFLFSGRIDLDDVNLMTEAQLPKETSETLGGFIYSRLGKVPVKGEVVEAGGLRLVVEEVSGRRIRKIRARRLKPRIPETEHDDHKNAAE